MVCIHWTNAVSHVYWTILSRLPISHLFWFSLYKYMENPALSRFENCLSCHHKYTVKPWMSHTSKEFIKCRLGSFSMGFTLLYLNLSICKNKWIAMNMWEQFWRAPYNHLIKMTKYLQHSIRNWRIRYVRNSFDVWLI